MMLSKGLVSCRKPTAGLPAVAYKLVSCLQTPRGVKATHPSPVQLLAAPPVSPHHSTSAMAMCAFSRAGTSRSHSSAKQKTSFLQSNPEGKKPRRQDQHQTESYLCLLWKERHHEHAVSHAMRAASISSWADAALRLADPREALSQRAQLIPVQHNWPYVAVPEQSQMFLKQKK